MELSLKNFDRKHSEFTNRVFPQITDFRGPLKHMKKEVKEAIASGEPEEFADILMLLLSSFRLRFPLCNTDDLLKAAAAKLEICEGRDWKMNDQGFAEHVK